MATNVFDLFAKISLDTEGYEKGLEGAKGKFSKFGDGLKSAAGKIGDVLAGIGKAAAVGIGAAGTALTALTKQSLDVYANFEQLEGGTELMFGSAADYIIEKSEQAYKTVQLSQNEYLQQVNGFAVGLKTALGGNEQAAAELADKIVQAEADIVAATGNTQEMVQNAFNGIMRSNYTMLDNLGLGIKPTKEGMEEVVEKVNEWNAANGKATSYVIDNLADVQSALVDYIEMQGMAGYASMEAGSTITGSIAGVKAAWQNFLSGNGNVKDFTDMLIPTVKNLREKLFTIIPRLTEGIEQLIDIVAPEIPPLIEETLPTIIDSASTLLTGLAERLPALIETILPSVINGVLKVSSAVVRIAPQIGKIALDIIGKCVDYLTTNMSTIVDKVLSVTGKILDKLTDPKNIVAVIKTATEIATSFVDALFGGDTMNRILKAAPEILKNLVTGITESLPVLADGLESIITSIVEWFSDGDNLLDLLQAAISILTALGQGMWDSLSIIVGKVGEIAEKIADAFGIGDYWRAGKKSIEDFADGVAAAYEECKEFFEGVGERIYEDLHPEARQSAQDILTQSLVEQNAPQAVIAQRQGAKSGEPTYFIGSTTSKIPHNIAEEYEMRYRHATGFYANRPTLLTNDLVGEAGDEVLLPLDTNTSWMDKLAEKLGARMGSGVIIESVVINANGGNGADIADSFIARMDEMLENRHISQSRGIGETGW